MLNEQTLLLYVVLIIQKLTCMWPWCVEFGLIPAAVIATYVQLFHL